MDKVFSHLTATIYSYKEILIVLAMIQLSACASNFPNDEYSAPAGSRHMTYVPGPGDKLKVTVYGHDDLSGHFSVDDTGRISLPLIRGITVKDLTLPDLETTITNHLTQNHIVNPKVSVELLEIRPFCVLGEVRNPGCFSHVHGISAGKAIALAGGYSYRAFKNKLAITRESGAKVVGNHETPVFGGDTIEVYERFF